MDEWLQQLQETLEVAAKDADRWLSEVSDQAERTLEQWVESSLALVEQVDRAIAPALEETFSQVNEQVDEALDTGIVFIDQQLTPWLEETAAPLTCTVNPWLQNHAACVGCRHYHGNVYGGEMLVCGMHPYGPELETCPDWESVWRQETQS